MDPAQKHLFTPNKTVSEIGTALYLKKQLFSFIQDFCFIYLESFLSKQKILFYFGSAYIWLPHSMLTKVIEGILP